MKKDIINSEWNFKEIVYNIKKIRDDYNRVLSSFSYFELPKKVEFKRSFRNQIYSLNITEYRKNLIWNYLNHFEYYYVLKQEAKKVKK